MILARHDITAELAGRNELRLHADIGAVEAEATSRRRGPLPDTAARVWLVNGLRGWVAVAVERVEQAVISEGDVR
jgi:hypothetical protein